MFYENQRECISIQSLSQDLRLLATDGAFNPVPTCAEVLLLAAQELLHSTHIGSGGEEGERAGEGDDRVIGKVRSIWGGGGGQVRQIVGVEEGGRQVVRRQVKYRRKEFGGLGC